MITRQALAARTKSMAALLEKVELGLLSGGLPILKQPETTAREQRIIIGHDSEQRRKVSRQADRTGQTEIDQSDRCKLLTYVGVSQGINADFGPGRETDQVQLARHRLGVTSNPVDCRLQILDGQASLEKWVRLTETVRHLLLEECIARLKEKIAIRRSWLKPIFQNISRITRIRQLPCYVKAFMLHGQHQQAAARRHDHRFTARRDACWRMKWNQRWTTDIANDPITVEFRPLFRGEGGCTDG